MTARRRAAAAATVTARPRARRRSRWLRWRRGSRRCWARSGCRRRQRRRCAASTRARSGSWSRCTRPARRRDAQARARPTASAAPRPPHARGRALPRLTLALARGARCVGAEDEGKRESHALLRLRLVCGRELPKPNEQSCVKEPHDEFHPASTFGKRATSAGAVSSVSVSVEVHGGGRYRGATPAGAPFVAGATFASTAVAGGGLSPEWDEAVDCVAERPEDALVSLHVYDRAGGGAPTLVAYEVRRSGLALASILCARTLSRSCPRPSPLGSSALARSAPGAADARAAQWVPRRAAALTDGLAAAVWHAAAAPALRDAPGRLQRRCAQQGAPPRQPRAHAWRRARKLPQRHFTQFDRLEHRLCPRGAALPAAQCGWRAAWRRSVGQGAYHLSPPSTRLLRRGATYYYASARLTETKRDRRVHRASHIHHMSNVRGVYPAPPPPAAPDGGVSEVGVAAIVIGVIVGLSIIACAVIFLFLRRPQVFGKPETPPYARSASSAVKKEANPPISELTTNSTIIEEEPDEEAPPEQLSKTMSAEDIALNEKLQEAWTTPRPAPAAAPESSAPKKALTMDEKLRQRAATRLEVRARCLSGPPIGRSEPNHVTRGGRPSREGATHELSVRGTSRPGAGRVRKILRPGVSMRKRKPFTSSKTRCLSG